MTLPLDEPGRVPGAPAGPEAHNSVLIRTHEPPHGTHNWIAPTIVAVAIVIGAGIWGFMATHPSGPVVNHSVGAAPATPGGF
jgi:nitric oxide reductase large subunit